MSLRTPILLLLCLVVTVLASCESTPLDRPALAKEYYNIATAYADLKQVDKAKTYYLRALELDPALAAASFNFARALVEQGKFTEALPVLEGLRRSDPANTLVLETLAYCLVKTGKVVEGEALYREVLARAGERAGVLLNLARLVKASQPVDAADFLRRARLVAPDSRLILLESARLAVDLKQEAEAWSLYDAWRKSPAEAGAKADNATLVAIALLAEKLDYQAKALEIWLELRTATPDDAQVHFALARINYTKARSYADAATSLEAALSKGYQDWPAVLDLFKAIDAELKDEYQAIVRKHLASFPDLPAAKPAPAPPKP